MPISRKFLDWTRPALRSAAEFLIARHSSGGEVELGGVVVVVPVSRAGRRLLEILVQLCEERDLRHSPPKFITVGALPELLYQPKKRFATDLEQQLAWVHTLRGQDAVELSKIVRAIPQTNDVRAWLDVASLFQQLHRELASDLLDFEHVVKQGLGVEGFVNERDRWEVLAKIQRSYLATLDELDLWDAQTARRLAIEKKECRTEHEIVLVGTADLNNALRKMLDQVEEQTPGRVTALVFAPPDLVDRFDSHGCVVPDVWETATIEIPESVILTAADSGDQADLVVRTIASFSANFRADEITIGMYDELLVPHIERVFAQCKLPARWGPGHSISRNSAYRLLESVSEYLEFRRPAAFAALVRHPDVAQWMAVQLIRGDWLTEIDDYHNAHFPVRWGEEWLGLEVESKTLRPVYVAIDKLLAPLADKSLPMHEWAPLVSDFLDAVFGRRLLDREVDSDSKLLFACRELAEGLQSLGTICVQLSPCTTATEAIEMALRQVEGVTIPPMTDVDAIELLGWLELPLDDAPALLVTTFNQSLSTDVDPFLPNSFRTKLNLVGTRRHARDAYALSLLLASRSELRLIVARRDTEKNPLAPNRLLFAADGETIARRAQQFFESRPPTETRVPLVGAWSVGCDASDLAIPQPKRESLSREQLNVTAYRSYLACPYRFYLRHIERLEALDDSADELDGGAFGGIMHAVLQRFALADERDSTNADQVAARLRHELNECVAATFGKRPAAAIAIQAEQMRARLEAFAVKQAERAAAGWRIEFAEREDTKWEWEVDGKPFVLTGRIDRIDVHEPTGKRAILDYKTSDSGLPPRRTHQKGDEWIDLQLPLYRYLAQGLGLTGPFELAYVLLPKDVSKTGFVVADWNDTELASADDAAREIVRKVREQIFWPPGVLPAVFSDEFAPLCQVGVYQGRPV